MTSLTPAIEDAIITSVRHGARPSSAARANGISIETLRRWTLIAQGETVWPNTDTEVSPDLVARIQSFVERLTRAQYEAAQVLEDQLYRNATTVNPKTGSTDTQALREWLSKHPASRDDWYDNKHQTIESTVTHRREDALIDSATPEQLSAWSALALPDHSK